MGGSRHDFRRLEVDAIQDSKDPGPMSAKPDRKLYTVYTAWYTMTANSQNKQPIKRAQRCNTYSHKRRQARKGGR